MRYRYIFIASAVLIGAGSGLCQPVLNQQLNSLPSRVLGHPNPEQLTVSSNAPNLVNGVEMWDPQGLALDTTANPPILYVADTLNNRVLAWKNSTSFSNGVKADMVIGQNDMFTTLPGGPGANPATPAGLFFPTGLTVDKTGALYVVDSGNNRVLRYPAPFAQKQSLISPDLVIGQPNLNSRQANYYQSGSTPVNEQCVSTVTGSGNSPLTAGLAFDSSGNLWLTDAGNARVLRYPKANIPAPDVGTTTGGIKADLVIGQPTLQSFNPTPFSQLTNPMQVKNQFGAISALGFDASGNNLYVVDSAGDGQTALGRVLVFQNPNSLPAGNGSANRILGVIPTGELTTLNLTGTAATTFVGQSFVNQPNSIFFLPDGSIGVVDTGYSRLLIFPPFANWPAEGAQYSPNANQVVGQNGSFTSIYPNAAQSKGLIAQGATPPASGSTLSNPSAAVFLGATNELFVTDAANSRMVVLPFSSGSFGSATRVLGQANLVENSPNYVEGREFWFTGVNSEAGLAIDTSGSVPHLYVADPWNNRVLGFYDARKVQANEKADLVIGQPDFNTAICNYNPATQTGGDPTLPNQTSLCVPAGVAVDGAGNLYVADSLNGRVMRFPAPFANYPSVARLEPADMVIGQAGFNAQLRQASQSQMVSPYGVAITGINGLLVSDSSLNRVLYFPFTSKGTFNPQTDSGNLQAAKIFGQTGYTTNFAGNSAANFNTPLGIATDAEGRLYVADSGNNRVSIFPDPNLPTTQSTGAFASLTIQNLGSPEGVFVNNRLTGTDEIWVTNSTGGTCLRFAPFDNLFTGVSGTTAEFSLSTAAAPIALATDQNGALYVADATNRIAVYYPALQALNGANFLSDRPLAPGMWASLCSPASNCSGGTTLFSTTTFTPQAQLFSQVPIPTVLGDVMVTVNGTAAPMEYVSPAQLNFYVPSNAPTSGFANIEVTQASTGQVLAAGLALMNSISPGVFELQYTGASRQAAVLNEDNTVNSSSNPAQRGHLIQVFATGQGVYSGWPADGVPAGGSNTVPAGLTQVLVGSCIVSEGTGIEGCNALPGDVGQGGPRNTWIPFTGLAPGEVGVWQVNVQIPMAVPPNSVATVELLLSGLASNDSPPPFKTVVYVK